MIFEKMEVYDGFSIRTITESQSPLAVNWSQVTSTTQRTTGGGEIHISLVSIQF